MLLMNGDRAVLQFSLDDMVIKVLDNEFLPYALKDYLTDTDFSSIDAMKKSSGNISVLKDYLCNRILNLSRDNAKAILHTMALPQRLKTDDQLKIVFACEGLSMIDNFWLRDETDTRSFSEVNLRTHYLKDAAYEISILGKNISATKDIMQPDIGTDGMYAKTWVRFSDGLWMWKTDHTQTSINSSAEKRASDLLDHTEIHHVNYSIFERDGRRITSCRCITNDEISMINAYELRDWCVHTGREIVDYLEDHFLTDFANMCVCDFVIANTDRHLGNINFLIDNSTNQIIRMAPLFDHNQALIADEFGTDISDLIYDVTGLSMRDSAIKYFPYSHTGFDPSFLPEKCKIRWFELLNENYACTN